MKRIPETTKRNVVRLHIQEGRTIASLSSEHGVCYVTISNWVRNYREECQNNTETKSEYELMKEIRKLQRQNAELEKENDFLKKAAAFFAKEID